MAVGGGDGGDGGFIIRINKDSECLWSLWYQMIINVVSKSYLSE